MPLHARSANMPLSKWVFGSVVVCVLLVGGYFRVARLNDTSMQGDAIIHDVCKAGATPSDILFKWIELVGPTSQMAVPAAFTKLVLDIFHLPPTRGNVILPSAAWGILTVLAALWVGWWLGGRWFGLLAMAVVALNPAHVQMSRMAYFYSPCVLGGFLMFWCLMEAWQSMLDPHRLQWRFHLIHAGAIGCFIYSSANAWLLAALFGVAIVCCSMVKWKRGQVPFSEVVILVGTYAVVGAPLFFVSWGVPALLLNKKDDAVSAYWKTIFAVGKAKPVLLLAAQELAELGWGWGPFRAFATTLVAVTGGAVMLVRSRRDVRWGMPLLLFIAGLLLAIVAMHGTAIVFGLRRVAAIWPFGLLLLAAGLAAPWLIEMPKRWKTAVHVVWGGFVTVLFGFWLAADILTVKVNGFPVPYRQIGQWADRHFPKGTPMVADRYFTAMCEFNQSDPPSNVVVISTVPNEIPEIQEKTRFRDVTRRYLEDNPDAIFYCAGHMYERPEVVPWEWPKQYFTRSQEMRDENAGSLSRIGQGYAGYPGVIRWPVIYYNTIEDVATIKRGQNETAFVLYGPDWRPVQTQDYRLWRLLLSNDAALRVYGVKDEAKEVVLDVGGVAAGGELRVKVGEQTETFSANQLVQRRFKVLLRPGENMVPVRCRGAANARLLIAKVTAGTL